MKYKEDIDIVKKRMEAFWNQEMMDRACAAIVAPKVKGVNISPFRNDLDFTGNRAGLIDYWTNPETIRKVNLTKIENTYFGGDAIPSIFQNYGTSGHCNYYGAKPDYQQDTIWFPQVIDSLEPENIVFHEEVLEKHLEICKYLVDHAGDDYFVGMPDSTGTLDAITHLYGSQNLLLDFLEEPELVKQAVKTINEGWKYSNEKFYQMTKENCQGSVHSWMHLWAPGRIQHMQVDISVMISADMYREFALPELEDQIEWPDYPVYHFDGIEQIKHLEYILSLEKLKAIQWTYVAGQPSAGHFIPVLQRIQAAGKSVIVMAPKSDIPVLLENLSADKLYIHCEVEDPEEAKEILKYIEKNSKCRRFS
ncbi:MAG: trimethylamine corrinoid protein 2 [Candidatus Limivivens sp.]|nr:trimethylamine corrinoid protein 2 [Candidatus Limivivens sp.]